MFGQLSGRYADNTLARLNPIGANAILHNDIGVPIRRCLQRMYPILYQIESEIRASSDQEMGSIESCAAIPGDLDGDGAVGVADLVILLGAWGPYPAQPDACPADVDLDDIVGITDLLILLANWR